MKIVADYHMHTTHSTDAFGGMEEMILSAIEKGLTEIAITDHVDLDYPPVSYFLLEEFNYNDYISEIQELSIKYEETIKIKRGVEVGLQTRVKSKIESWFNGKEFDFIIGSTHVVDFKDLYDGVYFEGKQKDAAVIEYFEDLYHSVKLFDMYNVYGHLDSVARYGSYPEKELDYNAVREIVDEILKLLIKKGKGIEVNTSGLRYGLRWPHPSPEILKRYKELGGEIITVGSDAHRPGDVANNFDKVYEIIKAAGFKAVATFSGGKPIFVDID